MVFRLDVYFGLILSPDHISSIAHNGCFVPSGGAASDTTVNLGPYLDNLSRTEPGPSIEPIIVPKLINLHSLSIVLWYVDQCHIKLGKPPATFPMYYKTYSGSGR